MSDNTPNETATDAEKRVYEKAAEVPFAVVEDAPFEFEARISSSRNRSDYMLALDERVKWSRENGKPVFLECPADKKSISDLEKKIRQSGTYTGNGIRFGNYQKSKKRGFAIVSFIATERIKRTRKSETPTES